MKRYLQMSEAEKWNHSLRERPVTTAMMLLVSFIPGGTALYVAVFIDDATFRLFGWLIWTILTAALLAALIIVWRLEERGTISERTKQYARRSMWFAGCLFSVAALIVLVWPVTPLRVRLQAGAVLCSMLVGSYYLKPLLR